MEEPATPAGLNQVLTTPLARLAAHEGGIQVLQAQQQAMLAQQSQLVDQLRRQEDCLHELADRLCRLAVVPQAQSHFPDRVPPIPDTFREPKLPLRYDWEVGKCWVSRIVCCVWVFFINFFIKRHSPPGMPPMTRGWLLFCPSWLGMPSLGRIRSSVQTISMWCRLLNARDGRGFRSRYLGPGGSYEIYSPPAREGDHSRVLHNLPSLCMTLNLWRANAGG